MNALARPAAPCAYPRHVRNGGNPDILAEIFDPEVNLVLWERSLDPDVAAYIGQLSGLTSLSLQSTGQRAELGAFLENHLPDSRERASFIADLDRLADMLECLFEPDALGLRLAILERPMCPRFHVDKVVCRLVTTYAGPGTEWLANNAVDRRLLGAGAQGKCDTESGICLDPDGQFRVGAGAVCLLKGEQWLGNQGRGIVHRSSAPARGESRLFMSIDLL